ncbi:MAG: hypothetical protein LKM36_14185 [Flavobacteriales bacterium]|jgi:hypothetical protein|nr:hypothetical protein [Flavobacteriales bacterium]
MERLRTRLSVGFFLAFVLFSTLPRSLFHHCEEKLSVAVDSATSTVHADAHCPICEAPVPICHAIPAVALTEHATLLAEVVAVRISSVANISAETPRLRGPPQAV